MTGGAVEGQPLLDLGHDLCRRPAPGALDELGPEVLLQAHAGEGGTAPIGGVHLMGTSRTWIVAMHLRQRSKR